MSAPASVVELVERFDAQRDSYRSDAYLETQVRREFIDPFFAALGWDVDNRKGYSEAHKEVIHEDAIKVGGRTKAPDYCFRAGGGVRSFFVEAKKPSVDIRDALSPAFQLRRYAWSAKLPVSILTDFEELAVYDCRIRPQKTDKAATARIIYRTYTEYLEHWDGLVELFSPEAIRRGSLDKLVASKKIKKGTAEVNTAFLDEIEAWRDVLARNIALRNPGIAPRELNFAVQRTIDRLVFLRICEDRGIEPYGRLQALMNGPHIYGRLGELFQQADQRYNSGLFHFSAERDRGEPPDEMTLGLTIDDKVLRDILGNLYFPESPYEFSVLPAEILGQVYEQFLGKVIRLTKGGQAKVEEKPEVRKAGGVYYTPAYIVEYIVKNTVGKLLGVEERGGKAEGGRGKDGEKGEGRGEKGEDATVGRSSTPSPNVGRSSTPSAFQDGVKLRPTSGKDNAEGKRLTPKEAAKLRILDPACGSGSFLIGAYQYLLDWHRDWYVAADAERHARGRNAVLYRGAGGQWKLTTAERKRILLNNIYGVDIDPQAVEVTKLSLLLKVLEGESEESIANQLRLFHERALPDLAGNIKCGNSLIGPDFYEGRQQTLLDDEERWRINVFDWHAEFPAVFQAGGFDAVIGNPPYVRSQLMESDARDYYGKGFRAATRTYDIYVLFVEQALRVSRANAEIGFILPNKFFTSDYGEGLRTVFAQTRALKRLVDFQDAQIFPRAGTYTTLLFCSPGHGANTEYVALGHRFADSGIAGIQDALATNELPFADLAITEDGARWTLAAGATGALLLRLQREWPSLTVLEPHIFQGLKTSADKLYMLSIEEQKGDVCVARNQLDEPLEIEQAILKPVVKGEHVQRYSIDSSANLRIVYPYQRNARGGAELIPEDDFERHFPLAWEYLKTKRDVLGARDKGIWARRPDWYAYARAQNIGTFLGKKLLLPYMTTRLRASLDTEGELFFVNITTGGYGLRAELGEHSQAYLLGILNSKLANHCILQMTSRFRGGYFAVNKQALERLPFRKIDFSNKADRARHDRLVSLVEAMLALHGQLSSARTADARRLIERQIAATDAQIDRLVYDLYALTAAEIAIVEGAYA